jgi:hypothetical protein
MVLGSVISRGLSLPREIRMVALIRVVKLEFQSNLRLEKFVFIYSKDKLENCLDAGQSLT